MPSAGVASVNDYLSRVYPALFSALCRCDEVRPPQPLAFLAAELEAGAQKQTGKAASRSGTLEWAGTDLFTYLNGGVRTELLAALRSVAVDQPREPLKEIAKMLRQGPSWTPATSTTAPAPNPAVATIEGEALRQSVAETKGHQYTVQRQRWQVRPEVCAATSSELFCSRGKSCWGGRPVPAKSQRSCTSRRPWARVHVHCLVRVYRRRTPRKSPTSQSVGAKAQRPKSSAPNRNAPIHGHEVKWPCRVPDYRSHMGSSAFESPTASFASIMFYRTTNTLYLFILRWSTACIVTGRHRHRSATLLLLLLRKDRERRLAPDASAAPSPGGPLAALLLAAPPTPRRPPPSSSSAP
jgi:hypothetical protein